jgi:hypothetical protein
MQTHEHDLSITSFVFSGFISCKLSIALRPKGVAAESSPKKLAAKFSVMYDIEG